MDGIKCPNCGLYNPGSACECDCGYSFIAARLTADGRARARRGKHDRLSMTMTVGLIAANVLLHAMQVRGTSTPAGIAGWAGEMAGIALGNLLLFGVVWAIARLAGAGKTSEARWRLAAETFAVLLALELFRNLFVPADSTLTRAAAVNAASTTSPDEPGDLQVAPDVVRHTALGFALPSPGPKFERSPETERQLARRFGGQAGAISWVFKRFDEPAQVVITALKGSPRDEAGFRQTAVMFRDGILKANVELTVIREQVNWNGTSGDYELAAKYGPIFMKTRCVTGSRAGHVEFLCVSTSSDRPDGLDFIREGLVVQP